MSDLEVIWDGSHGSTDRDLLCCPRLPAKRSAPTLPTPDRPPSHRVGLTLEVVIAALKDAPNRRATTEDLRAMTGLTDGAIRGAVQTLIKRRLVQIAGLRPRQKWKPMVVYGLIRRTR